MKCNEALNIISQLKQDNNKKFCKPYKSNRYVL